MGICTGWSAIGTPEDEPLRAAPPGTLEPVTEDPAPTPAAGGRVPANELIPPPGGDSEAGAAGE